MKDDDNNVFDPNASSSAAGALQVAGLNAGTYSGVWWDTFAGVAISNFTFTVASSNSPVTLNTPPILRSAALYIGLPPQANVTAPNLNQMLGTNSPAISMPLAIANSGGLPLGYSLVVTNPNAVAYSAINSSQPGGPVFAWKDISALGQDISSNFTALASPKTAADEGIAGPVNIGFAFPFFTNSFAQLYVSPNGFVAFSPFGGDTSTNTMLPGGSAPSNSIAFFWDDLNLSTTGHVYTLTDPINGTFTLQFQNVVFKNTAATVNCQLILKTTGEILMEYQSLAYSNTCTVGVQNAARNQGLTVAFNQNYLKSGFAVRLTPVSWLGLDGNAGFAPVSASNVVNVAFNPAGLAYGTYSATLLVQTGDANQPLVTLPVSLAITPRATWRQTHFSTAQNSGNAADTADPDHDGIINILEYAFDTDPNVPNANPISFAIVGNHLTVTFKRTHPAPADIIYTPQVANDLASGVWNSGPNFHLPNRDQQRRWHGNRRRHRQHSHRFGSSPLPANPDCSPINFPSHPSSGKYSAVIGVSTLFNRIDATESLLHAGAVMDKQTRILAKFPPSALLPRAANKSNCSKIRKRTDSNKLLLPEV